MKAEGDAKRLQRSVVADGGLAGLRASGVRISAEEKVQKLLLDVDDWLSNNRVYWTQPGRIVETGLTVYHYVTDPYDARPLSMFQEPIPGESRVAWVGRPEKKKSDEPDRLDN